MLSPVAHTSGQQDVQPLRSPPGEMRQKRGQRARKSAPRDTIKFFARLRRKKGPNLTAIRKARKAKLAANGVAKGTTVKQADEDEVAQSDEDEVAKSDENENPDED